MENIRAERRRKSALIKKAILKRKENWWRIETEYTYRGKVYTYTAEQTKLNIRRAVRNEGKWRHSTPRYWGCSPDCGYCNPHLRCAWRERDIKKMEDNFDFADFVEAMS